MGRQTAAGLDNFFAARTAGKRSVRSFFTDLSSVTRGDIQRNLTNVTGAYKKAVVTGVDCTSLDQHGNDTAIIQDFCNKHFGEYAIGNAYYELMKKEKVQDHKQVVIEDRATGKMYGGPQARQMLGLPSLGMVVVTPGDHGQYRIFVKSTSVNRKLVKGTEVLYQKAGGYHA